MGKLKQEHFVKKGIFLAPKSYTLVTDDAGDIIKHKGPAKGLVNYEWFESQYADLSRTKQVTVESNFRMDWHTLNIAKKDFQVSLGINAATKRDPVYDENNVWVDTKPKDVIDFGGQESSILKLELKILHEKYAELEELSLMKQKEDAQRIASLESEIAKLRSEMKSKFPERFPEEAHPVTESPTGLEVPPPAYYIHPPKSKNPKAKKKKKPG